MAEAGPAPLPAPRVTPPNRFRLSLVWLVPLVAVLIGAALIVRSLLASGPTIEIEFLTAEGIEAGKTEVRYKEVVIGRVESVALRADLQRVVVQVQLVSSAAGMAREDTQFWVVRPRVGAAGISGLGTLVSGAYIGVDAGVSEVERDRFVGLEAPPYMLRGEPGGSFVLLADDLGSLDVGSPIYYRRTRVGRVVGYTLDPARDELTVKIFVEAPYHSLVTPQTRFWNASGVDLRLDASGLAIDTQSVSSVLAGGISFERPPGEAAQAPAAGGSRFKLFNDRREALAPPDGEAVPVRMVFDQSVRGLAVGAAVDFLGIDIGTVRSITLQRDLRRSRFPVEVRADIYPVRLGSLREALLRGDPATAGPSAALRPPGGGASPDTAAVARLAAQGLKAQMRTGNLLTGQLYVALDFFRDGERSGADPAPRADRAQATGARAEARARRAERRAQRAAQLADQAEAQGVLTLPTVPGTLSELQPQVAQIVQRLSRVPFDEIGRGLQGTLAQASGAIARLTPEAQRSLAEVQGTLQRAQAALDRLDRNLLDESAPLQRQTEQTLAEVQRAAQSLRVLADYLQRHPESVLRGKPPDPPLPGGRDPGARR